MKKIIIAALILISLNTVAQKEVIPPAAKTAFSKAFPTASKVKWEKEDGNYEVTFEKDGKEMQSINYIGIIGVLVKEVQDLKKRVSELEKQNL